MTRSGLDKVLEAARAVLSSNPEIFKPIESFFGIDAAERLENPAYREGLYYSGY